MINSPASFRWPIKASGGGDRNAKVKGFHLCSLFPYVQIVMISDLTRVCTLEKKAVQVAKGKQEPSQDDMDDALGPSSLHPGFCVLQSKNKPGGRGAGSPPPFQDLKSAAKLLQAIGSVAAKISGIFMKGMTKGNHKVSDSFPGQTAMDLANQPLRAFNVL